MVIWRISNFIDLSGKGGLLAEGRWHTIGKPIIYCAESPASALLETVVHTRKQDKPDSFQLLEIEIPDENIENYPLMARERLDFKPADKISISTLGHLLGQVSRGRIPKLVDSQQIGNTWLKNISSLALRVPSVLVPFTYNIVLNPSHPLMSDVKILRSLRFPFDARLN